MFDGTTGGLLLEQTAFTNKYKGGVRVAGGDLNGDGFGDFIAGQGAKGSKVKVFQSSLRLKGLVDAAAAPIPTFDTVEFQAGAPRLRDGVTVAFGDTTGDGVAEIIVGRGRTGGTGGASVGIFQMGSITGGQAVGTATEIKTIPLSNTTYRYGARVAATDINFDGIADIIVGAGPMGRSVVQILDGATGNEISNLTAFPDAKNLGVFTAASTFPTTTVVRAV